MKLRLTNALFIKAILCFSLIFATYALSASAQPSYPELIPGETLNEQPRELHDTYTDNGDGTITDNLTGLMWIKDPGTLDSMWQSLTAPEWAPDKMLVWPDACKKCEDLVYAGYSDWRLPTLHELESIVHVNTLGPAFDTTYFTHPDGPVNLYYWSSSVSTFNPTYAWFIDFQCGVISQNVNTTHACVRPVRNDSAQNSDRQSSGAQLSFIDNNDGTITDLQTNLMWVKDPQALGGVWESTNTPAQMSWENALSNCEALEYAGYSDWRLPSRKELVRLIDVTSYAPTINTTYFPNTINEHYWTSSPDVAKDTRAWFVYFSHGYVNVNNKTSLYYVRPVRGPQN